MIEEEKKIEKFQETKKPENYEVNKHFSKNLLQKLGRSNIVDIRNLINSLRIGQVQSHTLTCFLLKIFKNKMKITKLIILNRLKNQIKH